MHADHINLAKPVKLPIAKSRARNIVIAGGSGFLAMELADLPGQNGP